jgi:prepilin-type N-terminal cleavage/methylation domain-containing protein
MKLLYKNKGFTLVELIVVIVILGILATTALPKFINLSSDSRKAALNGLAGSISSTVSLVHSKYIASGSTGPSVTMSDGSIVKVWDSSWGGSKGETVLGWDDRIFLAVNGSNGFHGSYIAAGDYRFNF